MNYLVTNNADDGSNGTLRAILAIINSRAVGNDTIYFDPLIKQIELTGGALPIDVSVSIIGNSQKVKIDGNLMTNLFVINGNQIPIITVNMTNIILVNGYNTSNGAGIQVKQTNLTLNQCDLELHRTVNAANGAAISAVRCKLKLDTCTLKNNIAIGIDKTILGAAIYAMDTDLQLANCVLDSNAFSSEKNECKGAGIYINGTTLTIDNTLFSNNRADRGIPTGSAIYVDTEVTSVKIDNCTFDANSSDVFYNNSQIANTVLNQSTFSNNHLVSFGSAYTGAAQLTNCTFSDNIIGLTLVGASDIVNCTLVNHRNSGIQQSKTNAVSRIANTIVANNQINDVIGNYASAGGNFIGLLGTATGFNANDQVGRLSPIDPLLNPLDYYGGLTKTHTPKMNSPVINAGSNINVNSLTDQRGFNRITDGTVDVGSVELQRVCLAGDSKVLIKQLTNNVITQLPIKDVHSDNHLVYSVLQNTFVPIVYNIVSGFATQFIQIKKDSINMGTPSEDLYLTSGHVVKINDTYLKASEVPGCIKVKLASQKIYTICTPEKDVIRVANMDITTYNIDTWNEYSIKKGIHWINN